MEHHHFSWVNHGKSTISVVIFHYFYGDVGYPFNSGWIPRLGHRQLRLSGLLTSTQNETDPETPRRTTAKMLDFHMFPPRKMAHVCNKTS